MTSITEDFFAMAQKLRHQRSVIITNHKHHVRFPCLDILHARVYAVLTIKQLLNYFSEYHLKGVLPMKKTYKIDVDCANCANKMEEAARKTPGVTAATVNFMALKMIVEFEEGQDPKAVMEQVRKNCKKVEDDCEIFL